jgi:hypothetical protein
LLHQYVHRVFWRLSREIGLRRPGDHTGPRVHDFRHRFAIRTLLDWYREGIDVEQQLPVLSTYLGHVCVRDTYWYLSACPELMEEAARRLERRWEAKPLSRAAMSLRSSSVTSPSGSCVSAMSAARHGAGSDGCRAGVHLVRHGSAGEAFFDNPQLLSGSPASAPLTAGRRSDGLTSLEIAPRKKRLRTGRAKEIITPLPGRFAL